MRQHRTEGIILQSLNFQDFDRILTVFSQNEGLIKLIVKGVNKKFVSSAPLTFSEFIYLKGKSDIYQCYEMNPIQLNLQLRKSFTSLEAVYAILKALLKTLPLHHPTPQLFSLLLWTLDKMPLVKDPHALSLSFLLKLLRHEGLFHISTVCTRCNTAANPVHFTENGETFCSLHAPQTTQIFQDAEVEKIKQLAFLSNLQDVKEIMIEESFRKKTYSLYEGLWV